MFIEGVPYCQDKVRGDTAAGVRWSAAVVAATSNAPKVHGPCQVEVSFVLPPNKYPTDHPYGPDLDNLLKRLFDALNKTIFSEVPGKDGSVISLKATKRKATNSETTGVHIIISSE